MVISRAASNGRWLRLLPVLGVFGAVALARAHAGESQPSFSGRIEQSGLVLEATISRSQVAAEHDTPLRSGEAVAVRFRVSDQSGKAITGAFPNGWMVLSGMGSTMAVNPEARCRLVLRRLQVSSLPDQAEVELNTFLGVEVNEREKILLLPPPVRLRGNRLLRVDDP